MFKLVPFYLILNIWRLKTQTTFKFNCKKFTIHKEQRCCESRVPRIVFYSDSDAYFNTYFYADFQRGYRAQTGQSVPVVVLDGPTPL